MLFYRHHLYSFVRMEVYCIVNTCILIAEISEANSLNYVELS